MMRISLHIAFGLVFSVLFISCAQHRAAVSSNPGAFRASLVAISVKNIDSTAAWYGRYLGFRLVEKKDFPDYKMSIGMLEKEGFNIELVQHQDSNPITKYVPNFDNPALIQGYGKIAYAVDNLDHIVTVMKAGSVRFILGVRDSKDENTGTCIVLDNNGNWVQLIGPR